MAFRPRWWWWWAFLGLLAVGARQCAPSPAAAAPERAGECEDSTCVVTGPPPVSVA
jgi:hypothetical protein